MRLVLPVTGVLIVTAIAVGARWAMRWTLADDSLEQSRRELDVLETELPERALAQVDDSARTWSSTLELLLSRAARELAGADALAPSHWVAAQRPGLRTSISEHAELADATLACITAAPAPEITRAVRAAAPEPDPNAARSLARLLCARSIVAAQDEHDGAAAASALASALDLGAALDRGYAQGARMRLEVQGVALRCLQELLACGTPRASELRSTIEPRLSWIDADDLLVRLQRELALVETRYHQEADDATLFARLNATEELARGYEFLLVMRRATPAGKGTLGSLVDALEPRKRDWIANDAPTRDEVELAQSFESWSMLTALARVALGLQEVRERRAGNTDALDDALQAERISADVPCTFAHDDTGITLRLAPPPGSRWVAGISDTSLAVWHWR